MFETLAERIVDDPGALDALSGREAIALAHDWAGVWARPEQLAPEGDWDVWLVLAGRGFGKTRAGAEWVRAQVAASSSPIRVALIGETAADTRDVLVEGESGLLSIYPEHERPLYEPSKRRVTWPNGSVATLFNATEPDQLRGPQFHVAWCDELAKWRYARETWDQLQFGMRLGFKPQTIITTTPRPIELIKSLVAGGEGKVAVTRGRTLDNAPNLSRRFIERVQTRYGSTRLGRQELEGEILGDIVGALWRLADIEAARVARVPELRRVVVAVDPAVSSGEDADDHGIIVAGLGADGEGYVIEDASCRGTPLIWARRAVGLFQLHGASAIVAEINQGGEMVTQTLRSISPTARIKTVHAVKAKHLRAEPIAALYEQGRIHHVGAWPELEAQMTQMTDAGYQGSGSPDRVDALVWAMTELFPDMVRPVAAAIPDYEPYRGV